ncbi:MAG: SRPBCC family protein, partial [Gemmatimonadales bacterium]
IMGAALGRALALGAGGSLPQAAAAIAILPSLAALDRNGPTATIHEVRSSIEVEAPAERVWRHVIAFPPLPQPTEWIFRLGVAYPRSARIEGTGVGATRYCVFSTGPFVEPITAWEPGRRLAFDVSRSPAPLQELSPYPAVTPPHLDGYLRARRGEFRLVSLPGGRTRLEGSTWYEVRMQPEGYWQLFSDPLIARIHRRVLEHVRRQAERTDSVEADE